MESERDIDVIVVGSGVAGLAAALTARERGAAAVLVAESEGVVGGSSRLSGGLIMGAGTRYQKALGIEDDPEAMFHDYMQLNRWNVDSGVVRRFSELAGPTVEWLGDLGVEYYDTLVFGGEERVPRVHVPIGRGHRVIDVLAGHCRDAGVDIALGRRVDRLLTDGRAVVGVAVGDDPLTAGAWSSPPAGSATARRSWPNTSPRRLEPAGPGTSAPRDRVATPSISVPR